MSALLHWKSPQGFYCPECSSTSYCTLKCRKIYQCNHCHHQTSLTSGTIFANTTLPLTREAGVSYNTAWSMKQKIMQVMKERDDSQPLTGIVQIDDAYYGYIFIYMSLNVGAIDVLNGEISPANDNSV